MSIKKIHVYDVDGTIVCSMHRFRTLKNGKIDLPYWIDNCTPEKIALDSLLPLAEQYKNDLLNKSVYVMIATARVLEKPDYDFITNKLGVPDKIISRNGRDDTRKGTDMKIAGIRFVQNLKQFKNASMVIFEDNTDYLKGICDYFQCTGVYIPSKQGV